MPKTRLSPMRRKFRLHATAVRTTHICRHTSLRNWRTLACNCRNTERKKTLSRTRTASPRLHTTHPNSARECHNCSVVFGDRGSQQRIVNR